MLLLVIWGISQHLPARQWLIVSAFVPFRVAIKNQTPRKRPDQTHRNTIEAAVAEKRSGPEDCNDYRCPD
jgi:hypothetical protein